MTISATIIEDSVSEDGIRLTSLQLRYPKFIHGELMTHRVFSRNAASSRAIPVERMIQDVMDAPAMPVYWGKNQKGMQADVEFEPNQQSILQGLWLQGRDNAVQLAKGLMHHGLHKQIANRVLEPWFHINTLVTATDWDNFFELRCHKDAQPEMRVLAENIRDAMANNTPAALSADEWHLPYVLPQERAELDTETLLKLSVARCARVSYLTQDGITPRLEQDIALYERLVAARPIHASPAEHQALQDTVVRVMSERQWRNKDQWRNFTGWRQHRAMLDQ